MAFFVPLIGWTAAALGAAAGGTATAGRAFKDELNIGEQAAAESEMQQGPYKGYDPSTGKTKQGTAEWILDGLLGNDRSEIDRISQGLHIKNVDKKLGGRVSAVNNLLNDVGADPSRQLVITATTNPEELERQIKALETKLPQVQEAQDLDPSGNHTVDSSVPSLRRGVRSGTRSETNTAYLESPQYQQYLDQLRKSDRQFQATMALQTGQMALSNKRADNQMELAQMQQQLQMRRQDSDDRRADRRDRQAMIQQMMAGLSTLGASIAI